MIYLLTDLDNHRDPCYKAFVNKDQALEEAQKCVEEIIKQYGTMAYYVNKPYEDCLFSVCGEERWRITVNEVELK